jgi:hypothetical protein
VDRDSVIGAISDHYKSAYGIRPRWMDFDEMSDQELLDAEQSFYEEAREAWEEEKAQMAESARRFEEKLLDLVNRGANDRTAALRWLVDALSEDWEPIHLPYMFCLEYNLPTEYEEEVRELLA